MTGKSRRTPSIVAVTRYWWAIGTTGMPSPTMRPTSAAQMPAAFTTTSHAIGPPSATTPATRPPLTVIATTRAPVRNFTPRPFAPSARAFASPAGSTWPSLGSQSAPSSDASVMSGNLSRASRAPTSSRWSPKRRAQRSRSAISLSRAGEEATRRLPTPFQPGSRPVSSRSRRYSSTLAMLIRVSSTEERSWPTRPAAWNVEPPVSSPRSRTTTTRAALIGGVSRRGDHDAVVGREGQRDRLPALEENARGVGHVHPQRSAVDCHLEPHEGPEERGDLEHAMKSVTPVVRRALGDDAELLGAERQDDPVAVSAAVQGDPQALAFPVHDAGPGRDDRTAEEVRNADEVGDEVGAGPRVDLDRAPDLLDPAVPHHRDAVGDRERLLLVVGDVDRRDPEVLLDLADLAAKSKTDLRVERRQRLIEQEDFRPAGERPRERDALLLAAARR